MPNTDVLASFPCASQRPNANSWLAKQDVPRGTRHPRTQSPASVQTPTRSLRTQSLASVQTPIRFHYDLFHHTLREALLQELLHHLRNWSVNNLCDSSLLDSVSRQSLAVPPTAPPSAAKVLRRHVPMVAESFGQGLRTWVLAQAAKSHVAKRLLGALAHQPIARRSVAAGVPAGTR